MNREQAKKLIKDTFESPFDKEKFVEFIHNLLNLKQDDIKNTTKGPWQGVFIPAPFRDYISKYERIAKFFSDSDRVDILIVYLKKSTSIERARTMQRNFIAGYLKGNYGSDTLKDASLVAFVSPGEEDWRFSLVKMDNRFEEGPSGRVKVREEFTLARRWSFLVGKNEKSHTAQSRLVSILEDDEHNPTLAQLEEAFNIEPVTKEFFEKYRTLLIRTVDELDKIVERNKKIKEDFESKNINTVDFAKKLLGQIVFLYFLQKKGWFGVPQDKKWGEGDKNFIRNLFERCKEQGKNFFNDYLEILFYNTLNNPRTDQADPTWSRDFNCKIPFLNGGLFEPIGSYDWDKTDIILPDELFSNKNGTHEGDGILDVFDLFNFTVKEDEPLEKEVAIDPELLGKLYEKFNAIREDNFKEYKKVLQSKRKDLEKKFNKKFGVYYTPREIVHYMCQKSLINYLHTELNSGPVYYEKFGESQFYLLENNQKKGQCELTIKHKSQPKISKEDIEKFIKEGEHFIENEKRVIERGKETKNYHYRIPESIRKNAKLIDDRLKDIKICDPAVGSGAFLVGMMHEVVKVRKILSVYLNEPDRTPYNFKLQCIENSLYGVDIDPGACEITKLRLWLSLIVDEEDIRRIKPLPNLDYKIACGNSLLGVEKDLFNNELFNQLEKLKPLYFNETNPTKKQEYKNQIEELISKITKGRKDFDFEVYFSEVFHEKKGFDVVIANPPYIDSEVMTKTDPNHRVLYSSLFKSASGNWDIFIIFIERGIQILKANGAITYIVPNKLIGARYAETLRKILLERDVREIRDFSKVDVFKEVAVYPVVFLMQNREGTRPVTITLMKSLEQSSERNIIPAEIFYKDTDWSRYFAPKEILKIVLKLSQYSPLSKYCRKISSAATVSEAYEIKKYIREKRSLKGKYKKLCNTGTIDRYVILWGKQKMQYIKSSFYKPVLRDEDLQAINPRRLKQANSEKIIVGGMTKELECAYDSGEFLAGKSTTIILDDPQNKLPLKIILALLNSTLISFWCKHFFSSLTLAGGYMRISEREINQIPIPGITHSKQNDFSKVVNKILFLTQSEDYLENPQKQAKVKEYEREIDQMVYKLYGLTEEEIKIIENYEKPSTKTR